MADVNKIKEHIKALLDCKLTFCVEHFGWEIYKLHDLTYQVYGEDEETYNTFVHIDDAVDFFMSQIK